MLERQRFRLRPRSGWADCAVLDGDTLTEIGSVRPLARRGPARVLDRWFGPGGAAVSESLDDSLVFAVRRLGLPFGPPRWHVCDSLDVALGFVGPAPARSHQRALIANRFWRRFAFVGHPGDDGRCIIRTGDGRTLGNAGDGWLEIADELADEPPVKMLLLAVALWLTATPAAKPRPAPVSP